jgi:hypothetical protein
VIDVAWLTRAERDELRLVLQLRRGALERSIRRHEREGGIDPPGPHLFVVKSLLEQLDAQ